MTRLPVLDGVRGAAVLGMIVFHAGWDWADMGLAGPSREISPAWQMFGNAVAVVFLALSGWSLVLAARRGVSAIGALRRLSLVLGAALAVTIGTAILSPSQTIWFGILHCIALGGIAALPLLRAGLVVVATLAMAMIAIPVLVPPTIDSGFGVWLGLPGPIVDTLDYRPLLPWAGFILIGVLLGRTVPEHWLASVRLAGRAGRTLRWLGRHSLAVYLLHQAVLFPATYGVAMSVRSIPTFGLDGFEPQCRAACVAGQRSQALCERTCACARQSVDPEARVSAATTGIDHERLGAIVTGCLAQKRL